jgi:hypothetical protein
MQDHRTVSGADSAIDLTPDEIEQAVHRLNVGLRMLRAIERDATFPIDPDTLETLQRNRDILTQEVADGERHVAAHNERGVEGYAERFPRAR